VIGSLAIEEFSTGVMIVSFFSLNNLSRSSTSFLACPARLAAKFLISSTILD